MRAISQGLSQAFQLTTSVAEARLAIDNPQQLPALEVADRRSKPKSVPRNDAGVADSRRSNRHRLEERTSVTTVQADWVLFKEVQLTEAPKAVDDLCCHPDHRCVLIKDPNKKLSIPTAVSAQLAKSGECMSRYKEMVKGAQLPSLENGDYSAFVLDPPFDAEDVECARKRIAPASASSVDGQSTNSDSDLSPVRSHQAKRRRTASSTGIDLTASTVANVEVIAVEEPLHDPQTAVAHSRQGGQSRALRIRGNHMAYAVLQCDRAHRDGCSEDGDQKCTFTVHLWVPIPESLKGRSNDRKRSDFKSRKIREVLSGATTFEQAKRDFQSKFRTTATMLQIYISGAHSPSSTWNENKNLRAGLPLMHAAKKSIREYMWQSQENLQSMQKPSAVLRDISTSINGSVVVDAQAAEEMPTVPLAKVQSMRKHLLNYMNCAEVLGVAASQDFGVRNTNLRAAISRASRSQQVVYFYNPSVSVALNSEAAPQILSSGPGNPLSPSTAPSSSLPGAVVIKSSARRSPQVANQPSDVRTPLSSIDVDMPVATQGRGSVLSDLFIVIGLVGGPAVKDLGQQLKHGCYTDGNYKRNHLGYKEQHFVVVPRLVDYVTKLPAEGTATVLASYICSKDNKKANVQIVQSFKRDVVQGYGLPEPPFFMIDKDDEFAHALGEVFPNVPVLLCDFHETKAISDWLYKHGFKDNRIRDRVMHLFKKCKRAPTLYLHQEYSKTITDTELLLDEMNGIDGSAAAEAISRSQAVEITKYFRDNWFCALWAKAWPTSSRMELCARNTNITSESIFKWEEVLYFCGEKHLSTARQIGKLTDQLVAHLVRFLRDQKDGIRAASRSRHDRHDEVEMRMGALYAAICSFRTTRLPSAGSGRIHRIEISLTQQHDDRQQQTVGIVHEYGNFEPIPQAVLFECTCPVWIVCGRICAHVHAARIHRGHAQPLQLSRMAVEEAAAKVASLRGPSGSVVQSSLADLDIAVHAGDIREDALHPSLHRPKKPGRKRQEVYAFHHGAMVQVKLNGVVHEAVFLGFDDDNTNNAVVIVKRNLGEVSVEKIDYQHVELEETVRRYNSVNEALSKSFLEGATRAVQAMTQTDVPMDDNEAAGADKSPDMVELVRRFFSLESGAYQVETLSSPLNISEQRGLKLYLSCGIASAIFSTSAMMLSYPLLLSRVLKSEAEGDAFLAHVLQLMAKKDHFGAQITTLEATGHRSLDQPRPCTIHLENTNCELFYDLICKNGTLFAPQVIHADFSYYPVMPANIPNGDVCSKVWRHVVDQCLGQAIRVSVADEPCVICNTSLIVGRTPEHDPSRENPLHWNAAEALRNHIVEEGGAEETVVHLLMSEVPLHITSSSTGAVYRLQVIIGGNCLSKKGSPHYVAWFYLPQSEYMRTQWGWWRYDSAEERVDRRTMPVIDLQEDLVEWESQRGYDALNLIYTREDWCATHTDGRNVDA